MHSAFRAVGRVLGTGVPVGAPGNESPQQETQGHLLLICWLGFRGSKGESDSAMLQVGAR